MGNPVLGKVLNLHCSVSLLQFYLLIHTVGQGTWAGGTNWVGYLTTFFNASLVLDYNLAVSGATINNSLVGGAAGDLVFQVESDFKAHYSSKPVSVRWKSDNAVFAFWIGINEYVLQDAVI